MGDTPVMLSEAKHLMVEESDPLGRPERSEGSRFSLSSRGLLAVAISKTIRFLSIIIFALFLMMPTGGFAQRISGIGLKGGANFSNILRPETVEKWTTKSGLIAGGFITFSFNEILSLQPEFLFSEKGAIWRGTFEGADVEVTTKLLYFDIPVLWKFYAPLGPNATVRPNLLMGPCWSYKLSGKLLIEWDKQSQENDVENLTDGDFCLLFGGGIDFNVANGKIFLDFRFGKSYAKISRAEKLKSRSLSVLISYSFN
jgi:hypothetical protein